MRNQQSESQPVFDVIRARRFELVDAKNRPWATLRFDEHDAPEFRMLNRSGRGEIILSFCEEEPELWFFSEGNTRVRLSVTQGDAELVLYDDRAHDGLKLHVDGQGEPHILTCTGQEEWTDVLTERRAKL